MNNIAKSATGETQDGRQRICGWEADEICTNADCPMCADYCPVHNDPGVCRFDDREDNDIRKVDKPRICEVLGVEVGEPFDFGSGTYIILETIGGEFLLYYFGQNSAPGSEVLSKMIAHRDRIIRKPRFTEEEVADARSITRLIDGSVGAEIERKETGTLRLLIPIGVIGSQAVVLDSMRFPSLRPGQSVALSDIVGAAP